MGDFSLKLRFNAFELAEELGGGDLGEPFVWLLVLLLRPFKKKLRFFF
jgi:hypothetical protein